MQMWVGRSWAQRHIMRKHKCTPVCRVLPCICIGDLNAQHGTLRAVGELPWTISLETRCMAWLEMPTHAPGLMRICSHCSCFALLVLQPTTASCPPASRRHAMSTLACHFLCNIFSCTSAGPDARPFQHVMGMHMHGRRVAPQSHCMSAASHSTPQICKPCMLLGARCKAWHAPLTPQIPYNKCPRLLGIFDESRPLPRIVLL